MHDGEGWDDDAPAAPAPQPSSAASGAALLLGLGSFGLSMIGLWAWTQAGPVGWPARESLAATGTGGLTLLVALGALVVGSGRRANAVAGLGIAAVGLFVMWSCAGLLVAVRPPPRAPVTQAEAAAFGALLAERISAGDAAYFDGRLDVDSMIARAGLKKPADVRGVRSGWLSSQTGGRSLGSEVVKAATGGQYTFVRVREREGQWTVLLRLVLPQGGMNIHELFLCHGADGQVAFDDLHMYAGDIRISSLMVRMLEDPALANSVTELGTLGRDGKLEEALAAYDRLPPAVQRRREVRVLRMVIAFRLGDDERYLEAARDLAEVVPQGDPALALTLFDVHFQGQDYDRCATDLEAVDAVLGGDAYVDALRAQVELSRGRPREALTRARAATTREPTLRLGQALLLESGLAAQDHAATLEALGRLEKEFHEDWGGLAEDPRFVDFVESPEYVAWSTGRGEAASTEEQTPPASSGRHATAAGDEER